MPKGNRKGAKFERDISRAISMWWTKGKRDDVFWRTPGSGARATARAGRGKSSLSGHGDIHFVHPTGRALCELCVIELKTGYSHVDLFGLMVNRHKADTWQKWLKQVKRQQKEAGTRYWLLVVRILHKHVLAVLPFGLYYELLQCGSFRENVPDHVFVKGKGLVVMLLDSFFQCVSPKHIRELADE